MREKIAALVKEIRYKPEYNPKQSWQFADDILKAISEEIEKGLMKEDEIASLFYPIPRAKLQMRWMEAIAQAQLDKILTLLKE